jgi:hypothetical protein
MVSFMYTCPRCNRHLTKHTGEFLDVPNCPPIDYYFKCPVCEANVLVTYSQQMEVLNVREWNPDLPIITLKDVEHILGIDKDD